MARLRIEFRGAETVLPLAEGETTVGRSNRCTIRLPDPGLAEVHFRIRSRTKGYQLKDDGSGLGTHVNGKPVFATTLDHGDLIEAGHLRCQFLLEADAPLPPPPPPLVPPPPERAPRPPPRKEINRTYVLAGVGALAALAAVFLLLRGSPEKEARQLWTEAQSVLDESRRIARADDPELGRAEDELRRAADLLEKIRADYGDTRVAATARLALNGARRDLESLDRLRTEERKLRGELEEDQLQDAYARLAPLKQGAHPVVVVRVEELEKRLQQDRIARFEREFSVAEREAAALAQQRRFGDALKRWWAYATSDYLYRQRADRARGAIEKKIAEEYRALLRLAGRNEELDVKIGLLEASRPVFKGTAHSEDLEVRISALRARRARKTIVVLDTPKPKPTEEAPEEGQTPEQEPTEYADPPRVVELVGRRRYAEAASLLNSISRHPHAKVRTEELTLLANLMADLVAAVAAQPQEFTNILLPKGAGRGDAVGADARYLRVKKSDAETQYAWDALSKKAFPRLFRIAGFLQPQRLAVAVFYDEEGDDRAAERVYVAVFKSERAPTTLKRILARRRGIDIPEKGFQLFRNRLVTEAEREHILLLERVAKLAKQAREKNEKRRRAAWAELEKIGEPAVEALALALRDRRTLVADSLEKSKAFSGPRFAQKFGSDLKARRKEALAFIRDAQKYPYPNKSDDAQKEAERLVDRVREIWDKPYERLMESSDAAKALDAELKELDQRLVRLDPLGEPRYDSVVEAVAKKLEVRVIAIDGQDKGRIEYNLSVEKYNRDLQSSADDEERANVKAVNEYRWMMGLSSVKLDERLLRAARKHSIEMQQRNYFAHNSPTPHLRTPSQRARREGYPGGVSENIARGAGTGRQAFWQWFKSSGHHRNMVGGHTEMGCGAANHHWWTQKFGRATGRNLTPPKVPTDPDPPGTSGNGDPAPGQ